MENYRNTGAEFILRTGRFGLPRTVKVTVADESTRHREVRTWIVSSALGPYSHEGVAL